MKQKLLSLGWQYKGNCRCSGLHTTKYELQTKDGEYKLRVRNAHFLLSTPTRRFMRYPISELINMVNEIDKVNKTVIS